MSAVSLGDPNLSGPIWFDIESRDDLDRIMSKTGIWQDIPGTTGVVLLSNPHAQVFNYQINWEEYTDTPYPDFLVELTHDGSGTVWERA